ncbi:transporter, NhaC family [Schinkia azotoformans MEV2011]|uniref:Transporter, NhaC family n=1 Tax=Schinkia azotoformans MEV2011 TaxID=1348973 RepID=A0A072NII3_SCHAZ|nr:Na+/H+ antiporter NhaC [Schinkia azotoformans]KEF37052.1 transporter, NhaC family [Schinkia azotoformans MEV2011]MEC1697675.1 Na+/H+ antiporter NhaC [Schinkia azotoformans]MEC1718584.1 Na+/H+ antiporter NhaC [Schinkia azotoformans]MEC1727467.1 Na+/H+ antiporter NhaC [Schinkia azotoformans]MEC1739364.1 Na+/H+ antiporter NhaC [Schinkia azotoformans]
MQQDISVLRMKSFEALIIIIILLVFISYSMISLGVVPHIPITLSIIGLIAYGLVKKVSIKDLEKGMTNGVQSGIGAVFIFFFIGMLISSWIAGGTIPTFIYAALSLDSSQYFYTIVFLVTSIIGLFIGSSLTTAATLGVTFISVATALDLSLAITAGAVVSGAFFGDKLSPLSDTTNLSSMVVGVDLFEHIKNMLWTTVPAFVLSLVLFMFLSPGEQISQIDKMDELKGMLLELNLVHWYSVIPFLLLAILAVKKVSAIVTLGTSTLSALILTPFVQTNFPLEKILSLLYFGYKSETGNAEIDSLLTRGGMESMMFSISLVLLALSMGGLLLKLGIISALLDGIKKYLIKPSILIFSTALSSIGVNFLMGEQYLSILLPGNTFVQSYKEINLHPKNLSRVLEDAGTVVNPLVPWSVCGIFITGVLGVPTIEYSIFAFFCLLSPVLTIIAGITGISISKLKK